MALVYVGPMNIPNYTALSSDIADNKITGAVKPGNTIYLSDTSAWKIIKPDLTLADYAIPASFAGSISLGAVTVGTAYTMSDGVGNYSLIMESEAGGDVGSASLSNLPYIFNGATWDRERTPSVFKDVAGVAITTIATVWTPAGGKKFRIMGGSFSVSGACSVLFEDNANPNTLFRTPKLEADKPYTFALGNGILSGAADRVLKATASTGTVTMTGYLYGTEE